MTAPAEVLRQIMQQPVMGGPGPEREEALQVLPLIEERDRNGGLWNMALAYSYGIMAGKRMERRKRKARDQRSER